MSAPQDDRPEGFPPDEMPAIRRVMTPQDTNAMGTVFGGAILSEIDLAAAIAAHRHHCGNVVTVAMDRIEFLMRASLPPSPVPSPNQSRKSSTETEEGEDKKSTKEQEDEARRDVEDPEHVTPTKVLDVSAKNCS